MGANAMTSITPQLTKAIEIAAALVDCEVSKCRRLNPQIAPEEIWAGIGLDGRIVVGHPLLPAGRGLYVDHHGCWTEA